MGSLSIAAAHKWPSLFVAGAAASLSHAGSRASDFIAVHFPVGACVLQVHIIHLLRILVFFLADQGEH